MIIFVINFKQILKGNFCKHLKLAEIKVLMVECICLQPHVVVHTRVTEMAFFKLTDSKI